VSHNTLFAILFPIGAVLFLLLVRITARTLEHGWKVGWRRLLRWRAARQQRRLSPPAN